MEPEATHVRFQHFDDYGPDYWTDWLPLPLERRTRLYHRHAMKVEYKRIDDEKAQDGVDRS